MEHTSHRSYMSRGSRTMIDQNEQSTICYRSCLFNLTWLRLLTLLSPTTLNNFAPPTTPLPHSEETTRPPPPNPPRLSHPQIASTTPQLLSAYPMQNQHHSAPNFFSSASSTPPSPVPDNCVETTSPLRRTRLFRSSVHRQGRCGGVLLMLERDNPVLLLGSLLVCSCWVEMMFHRLSRYPGMACCVAFFGELSDRRSVHLVKIYVSLIDQI